MLLRLNDEGRFEYLYNEVPFMDTSDTSWMPGRKPSDEERFETSAFDSQGLRSKEQPISSYTAASSLGIKTYVCCQDKPIDDALLDPFSVGEGIRHTTVYKLNGEAPAPLAYRPFGVLTIVGDVAAVLPAVLAWIDPEATVNTLGLSWRDVISANLLRGESVNIDELPAGVLLKRLPRKNGNHKSNNLLGNVLAKASAIVAALLALLTKSRK